MMPNKLKNIIVLTLLCLCTFAIRAQTTIVNDITGITGDALKNAQNRLAISQKKHQGKISRRDIDHYIEKAPNEIKQAIQPFGYFKSIINTQIARNNQTVTFHFHVNPGPALKITSLKIKLIGEGTKDWSIRKKISTLVLKKGDVFNVKNYDKAESDILSTAQYRGYLHAKFIKKDLIINLRHYTCNINLTLDTGKRYYYGPVTFSKTPIEDSLLQRYKPFKTGVPFSYSRLILFQQYLMGSGYFERAAVVPDDKNPKGHQIPIHVDLKMRKRRSYLFGVGYGTSSGARLTLGHDVHWVNRWGHQLHIYMKLSHTEQNVFARYTIPGSRPAHDKYFITAGLYKQEPKDGESFTKSIGIGHLRNYTRWQRTIELKYEFERYRFHDNEPYQDSHLLLPSLTLTRTYARELINTKNGSQFTIGLRGASRSLFSSVSFIQTDLQYKWIKTLAEDNRFLLRGDFGYTIVHDLNKLPLSKHFYTGGIASVRGYSYKSLGPGRYLAIASVEYQRRIKGNWYAAVFYDVGNAMDHFSDSYKQGTGVGVVWQSPVGAVKVYVATALSKKSHPIRLEFSLGPDL